MSEQVDILVEKETKKEKRILKRVLLIIAFLLTLAILGLIFLFSIRPDVKFRIKEYLTIGREDVISTMVTVDEAQIEKISVDEFIQRENVQFNQSLMLINKEYMLGDSFQAEMAEYKTTGVMMNSSMTADYGKLSKSVTDKFSQTLLVMSSYRTAEEQKELYDEKGPDTAITPGASEHQSGLALDVYVKNYAGEGFLKSEVGRYVNSNCQNFGFIIRYPQFTDDITGIRFEPWHIRYVGLPHSKIIYSNAMTLEEYIDTINIGEFYKSGEYIYTRQVEGTDIEVPSNCTEYVISSDNTGCYIITGKR